MVYLKYFYHYYFLLHNQSFSTTIATTSNNFLENSVAKTYFRNAEIWE